MPPTSLCLWSEQSRKCLYSSLTAPTFTFAGSICDDVACNALTACVSLISMLITLVAHMQVLDRRWFHGKRCLDIGCNEGVITLAAVQRFAPLSMLGVDIDAGLIKTACRYASAVMTSWAVRYTTKVVIKCTPTGVVCSFLFCSRDVTGKVLLLCSQHLQPYVLLHICSPLGTLAMPLTMWSGI